MTDCAFCDRAMFEERIIFEDDSFYVIATLGQITDGGYVLIFPKRHVRCMSALEGEEMVLFVRLLIKAQGAIEGEYRSLVALFEHGIVGQTIKHAHIHLVPTDADLRPLVDRDFPHVSYGRHDIVAHGIPQVAKDDIHPYLLWRSGRAHAVTHMWHDPSPVPLQYFRTILAEELGRPERANWREMDSELDRKLWSSTVQRLKRYF